MLPPFLDAWVDSSSPTFVFSPLQKRYFSLPHLREYCWYLECKRTWQPDEEAAFKIQLSGGEPPSQSDEVVLQESELQEVDEVVATLDEANTQKSNRKKRATQDESSSHPKRALGVTRSDVGMADLVIADLPENLPVPNVSDPSYNVPSWNALDSDFLDELFDFADEILHDDGALLLFHPDDNGELRESIEDHFAAFGFTIFKEWLGINRLRLS